MDIYNQITSTHTLKLVLLIFYLVLTLMIIIYNWFYLKNVIHSSKRIDLEPPGRISHLVNITMMTSGFTALLIMVFLLTGFY